MSQPSWEKKGETSRRQPEERGLCPGRVLRGRVHAHLVTLTRPQLLTSSVPLETGPRGLDRGRPLPRRGLRLLAHGFPAPGVPAGRSSRVRPTCVCPKTATFIQFVSGSLRHPQVNSPEGPTELGKAVVQTGALSPGKPGPTSSPSPGRPPPLPPAVALGPPGTSSKCGRRVCPLPTA